MTRAQAAILRFVLICAAWAVGQTLTWGLAFGPIGVVIPAVLAVGVLVVTEDLGRPRPGGGDLKYWRGRRVDDDERRGRWN
ncbi:MAG TPA: hypothetical protein VGS01_03370 [Candidatus Limnocylindria bacterium]|jgi:hypothetical protein|nr:hypothetical protein [Candidatus Limnocylindria bacterium]